MVVNMAIPKKLLVIAAEASGDELGAEFITEVRKLSPNIEIRGMGGPKMANAGVTSEVSIDGLSIFGIVEALKALKTAEEKAEEIAEYADYWEADTAVLIDSWGFSVRAGKAIKKAIPNIRLIKMVGPQVWATRPERAKKLAKIFDELWCIHDFELPFYKDFDIKVSVIGNPALARVKATDVYDGSKRKYVGLLPGSRNSEITKLLPNMLEAAKKLNQVTRLPFLLVVANGKEKLIDDIINQSGLADTKWLFKVDETIKEASFLQMRAAIACSGTVTTELAVASVPMVMGYRLDSISYFIAKTFLLKTKYVNIINVEMDAEIIPELLQGEFYPDNILWHLVKLLKDVKLRNKQLMYQNLALKKMGLGSQPAAEVAARLLINQ